MSSCPINLSEIKDKQNPIKQGGKPTDRATFEDDGSVDNHEDHESMPEPAYPCGTLAKGARKEPPPKDIKGP
jgi:hypothetical protein